MLLLLAKDRSRIVTRKRPGEQTPQTPNYFSLARNRCIRASSIARSLPKTLVKAFRRCVAECSLNASPFVVFARYSTYFLGLVSMRKNDSAQASAYASLGSDAKERSEPMNCASASDRRRLLAN